MGTVRCSPAGIHSLANRHPVSQTYWQVPTDGRTTNDKKGCLDGDSDNRILAVDSGAGAVLRAQATGERLGPALPEATATPAGERAAPVVPEHPEVVPAAGVVVDAPLTFYVCTGAPAGFDDGYCGGMANGEVVYAGAAACGYGFALGQRFSIENDPALRTYVCADRGLGAWNWVDVWFSDYADGRAWRDQLPTYVTVRLLP